MAIFHRSLQLFHFFDDHFRFLRYFGLLSPNKIHRPLALQAIYDDVLPRHRIPLRIFIIEKMAQFKRTMIFLHSALFQA